MVMLMAKVKDVWANATPRHPKPAIGRTSLRLSLLCGSMMRKTQYISRPPTTKRMATIESGGMDWAANLIAA